MYFLPNLLQLFHSNATVLLREHLCEPAISPIESLRIDASLLCVLRVLVSTDLRLDSICFCARHAAFVDPITPGSYIPGPVVPSVSSTRAHELRRESANFLKACTFTIVVVVCQSTRVARRFFTSSVPRVSRVCAARCNPRVTNFPLHYFLIFTYHFFSRHDSSDTPGNSRPPLHIALM